MKLLFVVVFFVINCNAQKLTLEQRFEIQSLFEKLKNQLTPEDVLIISDKILEIDSSNDNAIAYKAISYFRKKDYQQSLKIFNSYLKKKPNSNFRIERAHLKLVMEDTIGSLLDIDSSLSISGYDQTISDRIADFFEPDKRLEKYFEKAIKLHPDNFISYIAMGNIKKKQKNYISADEKYTSAITELNKDIFLKQSDFWWLYNLKASNQFTQKKFKEAEETIKLAILLNPKNSNNYLILIRSYLALGENENACIGINELQKIDTSFHPSSKFNCDFTKNKPKNDFFKNIDLEKFYTQGNSIILSDTNAFKKAIYYYSKTLELKPNHIYALARRSYVYLLLNQYDMELNDLNKIIQIDSKCAIALDYRAGANTDKGFLKEAFKDASDAIKIDSTNAKYWITRASISSRLGDTIRALSDLTKAIRLNPYNSRIYFERGLIELEFNDNAKQALIDFLKAIEIEENKVFDYGYPTYYYNCAMAYNKLMEYDKAITQIEKAISLKPNYATYYYRCGEIKARMKNMTGACNDWNKAKQLGYKNAEEVLLYNCNVDQR